MARKKNPSLFERVGEIQLHRLLFHPATLFILATGVVISVASMLWEHQLATITDSRYQLKPESLAVNSPPQWVHTDFVNNVYARHGLNEVSLLDPGATEDVWNAFSADPRVAEVVEVAKSTSGVRVELNYREPVAMVEVGDQHLLAVDAAGVVLDGRDFQVGDGEQYIHIAVNRPQTQGILTGQAWPDPRLVAAAAIAAELGDEWSALGIRRVVSLEEPGWQAGSPGSFELWTANGKRILWGSAPGNETADEAAAVVKLESLRNNWEQVHRLRPNQRIWDLRQGQIQPYSALRNVSH